MATLTEDRKKMLKELIRQLHAGAPPQKVKEELKRVLQDVSSLEVAKVEEELINEGMPREEVHKLCDIHLAVFREQLEKQKAEVAPEAPINILTEEHKIFLQTATELATITNKVRQSDALGALKQEMTQLYDFTPHISQNRLC